MDPCTHLMWCIKCSRIIIKYDQLHSLSSQYLTGPVVHIGVSVSQYTTYKSEEEFEASNTHNFTTITFITLPHHVLHNHTCNMAQIADIYKYKAHCSYFCKWNKSFLMLKFNLKIKNRGLSVKLVTIRMTRDPNDYAFLCCHRSQCTVGKMWGEKCERPLAEWEDCGSVQGVGGVFYLYLGTAEL